MALIGIDIGTSNSCAAFWDGRAARMIELGEGINTILPSVVTIAEGGVYVGQDAIEMGKRYPDYCFRHFKRRLAEPWHHDEDSGDRTTCEGVDESGQPNGLTYYQGPDGTKYSPVVLTAYLIEALVRAANERLSPHDSVTGAVICVPADFTQSQRMAVAEAAKMAGLARVEVMHEPTAAALAYGYDAKKARRIAIFDLGGGTFDLSIVQTGGGLVDVLTTNGVRDLGGTDFDQRIADYVVNLWEQHNTFSSKKARDSALIRIGPEAEAVKKRLSDRTEAPFRLEGIDRTKEGVSLNMIYSIERETFESLTRDLRDRIMLACKMAVDDARRDDPNFSVKDLHDVLLVGGMTRVPSVRATVAEFFGKPPKKDESPEQVVAMGAAIRAAILDGRKPDITIADITSHTLALETAGGVAAVLFPKGTSYPIEDTFQIANEDDDQKQLSIRLIQGEAHRASVCELLWSAEIPVEPSPATKSVKPLTAKLDASGRPFVTIGGLEYRGGEA